MKIVSVITKDGLELYGMMNDINHSKAMFLHTHGTGSSFYMEGYEQEIMEVLGLKNIDSLFVNNRGAYLLEAWQQSGAAVEKFEDSVFDIDAWIKFALDNGYESIILSGHSLGSEKVAYYSKNGNYKNKVTKLFLLGFSDSFGSQERYLKKNDFDFMEEANNLVEQSFGQRLLSSGLPVHSGEIPMSAQSYIDFYGSDNKFKQALPFASGNLEHLKDITIPVIGIIGDDEHEEWTIVPIDVAMNLLKDTLLDFTGYKLVNCSHTFTNHHKELSSIISKHI
ncbi:MAG: hypothetical protein LiPW30_668 [Parcubacteria group bacterium LiPW_30]|nr:MAG: hypothetical protein LiPW30_668 [Parcubacteria group bacterium LiPW_30]